MRDPAGQAAEGCTTRPSLLQRKDLPDRNRSAMNRVTKIGFIVVEDLAKHVVEPLARRVFGPGFLAYAVTFGAKGMLPGAYATALFLLREKSYAHVVLVFDADSTDPDDVETEQRQAEKDFHKY